MFIIDYEPNEECKNKDAYYICLKCGMCGRKFENGYMVELARNEVEE